MKEEMIETTCFLIDSKIKDLGISPEPEPVKCSFLPSQIEGIRENINDDETEVCSTECLIYFKSGTSLIVQMSYDEVKAAMKK